MTRISQIIAVVGGVKSDVTSQISALEANVTQPKLLEGLSREYRPRDMDNGVQLPPQSTRVQVTAEETLDKLAVLLSRLFDTTRTLDEANAKASADVVVDGTTLLSKVTTSHLLFLERELGQLSAFVSKLPTLDPAETWTTEGTEPGQHKTAATETTRTEKQPYNHVLAEATREHPAQVQVVARDEVIGYWKLVKFSGAIDPRRKRALLDRLTKLREAVKYAREEANASEVRDVPEGSRIFEWLWAV